MSSLRILVLADGGIGGTEKAASIYAGELSKRGHQVTFAGNRGPRTAFLEETGVRILPKASDVSQMAELIKSIEPDVIHQHVPGYPCENPVYEALEKFDLRPKFMQTNVFGRLSEPRAIESVDFHLFISKASGSQAFRRAKLPLNENWLKKCSVVMYPMPERTEPDPAFRNAFRREIGIDEQTILAIRVGQCAVGKWTDWEAKAICTAAGLGAKVKLVLMQPPDDLLPRFRKAFSRGLLKILPATSDFNFLNNLYSAADVMVHASNFGESFGYTIAEGMAAGLPVICRSTPWGDSAQVELVENGVSGWTCATPSEMGRRLSEMSDRSTRFAMGTAGRVRIGGLSELQREISLLEEVMLHLVSGKNVPAIAKRNLAFASFHEELPSRERTFSQNPLPFAERLEWMGYRSYRTFRTFVGRRLKKFRRK